MWASCAAGGGRWVDVAERLADRIGIIQAGKLRAEGTLDELRARAGDAGGSLEDVYLQLVGDEIG